MKISERRENLTASRIRADLIVSVNSHDLSTTCRAPGDIILISKQQANVDSIRSTNLKYARTCWQSKFREHYTSGCGISDSRFAIRDS